MSEKFIDKVRNSIIQRLEKRKIPSQRRNLSNQLRSARHLQRHKFVVIDRPMSGDEEVDNRVDNPGGYIDTFLGLTHFFNAARIASQNPVVLDIGAGTTRAITQISKSPLGEGISFVATSVAFDKRVNSEDGIGAENFRVTSAEKLRGIENNSIAAVLAMASLAYSDFPSQSIKRINEVLVDGGLIKATFNNRNNNKKFNMHTHDAFSNALLKLGYDVAVKKIPSGMDILVAVKPGKSTSIKARELLNSDLKEYQNSHEDTYFG